MQDEARADAAREDFDVIADHKLDEGEPTHAQLAQAHVDATTHLDQALTTIHGLREQARVLQEALKETERFFDAFRRITTRESLWEMACTNYAEQVHRGVAAALARTEAQRTGRDHPKECAGGQACNAMEEERDRLQSEVAFLRARANAVAPIVTAALNWDNLGALKALHVLTCPDCERLEAAESRWCEQAVKMSREQLEAAKMLRKALEEALEDGR